MTQTTRHTSYFIPHSYDTILVADDTKAYLPYPVEYDDHHILSDAASLTGLVN